MKRLSGLDAMQDPSFVRMASLLDPMFGYGDWDVGRSGYALGATLSSMDLFGIPGIYLGYAGLSNLRRKRYVLSALQLGLGWWVTGSAVLRNYRYINDVRQRAQSVLNQPGGTAS